MSKGMNFMSGLMGTTAAVRVGGNLVTNISRSARGKAPIPLYKKGDYKSLARDVVGIAALGSASLGAMKGLGATARATQTVVKPTVQSGIAREYAWLSRARRSADATWKAFKAIKKGY